MAQPPAPPPLEIRRPIELPPEVFEAQQLQHRDEIAKLQMRLIRYRLVLEQHGIEPPDDTGADLLAMWRDCRNVIQAAQMCVANLGTSKEMLQRWS